jgi:hypothetical protein
LSNLLWSTSGHTGTVDNFAGFTTGGAAAFFTGNAATALLDAFAGDSGSGCLKGLVPAAVIGDGTKFLRGDATWQAVSGGGASAITIDGKTGAYTVVAGDLGKVINCTANTFTVTLTAAATLGAGFWCWVWNTSTTLSHVITIDPNASETIDGVTTLLLRRGEGMQIVCDGTNWQTGDKKAMRGYAENISTPAATLPSVGDGAISLGGRLSHAGGAGSFGVLIGIDSSNYGARGANSIAIGSETNAAGTRGVAIGTGATAGFNATVIGAYSSANATNATACGWTATATGYATAIGAATNAAQEFSLSTGYYTVANSVGKFVHGSGRFSASGDAQTGKTVLRRATTDATATVLTANNSAPSTTNQVILPNDSTYAFTALVVARRTDADNESAGYKFEGVVDRNATAATTALVGVVTKTVLAEDTSAWDCEVTADTTNGGLAFTVTGETGKTIRWVATVWTTEVTG